MNIVLIGKTGSGKSTICDWLTDKLRYDKVITCTTRPKRGNETSEYYFVTDEEYDSLDLVLKTSINGFRYGVKRSDLVGADCKIIILDPSGVKELAHIDGFDFICVYVECPTYQRMHRCQMRGDGYFNIIERMNEEIHMFDGFVPKFTVDNSDGNFNNAVLGILEAVKEADDCLRQSYTK